MNITGRLFKKYPERSFNGKNGTVVTRDFAIETTENSYQNYYLFSAMNDILDKLENFRIGDTVDVKYVINGRLGSGQYDGRIFMSLKALDVRLYMQNDDQSRGQYEEPVMPTGNSQFEEPSLLEEDNGLPF